tara:strand:- start:490 stop:1164 length:675 start_codon:yes stop_codon:yes gene_type:complete
MRIIRKNEEKQLIESFIKNFKKIADKRERSKKRFSFVLTGGSSPIKLYKMLSKEKINWKNIDFFWGDERFVGKRSNFSNYNLAYKNFFKNLNISKNQIYSINTNLSSVKMSSKNYSDKIKKYFKNKKICFDLMLLGMGNDGHIASIFPNNLNKKSNKITRFVIREDFQRITINLKIINNSRNIFLWLNTRKKSKIYNLLNENNKNSQIPVNLLNQSKTLVFSIF